MSVNFLHKHMKNWKIVGFLHQIKVYLLSLFYGEFLLKTKKIIVFRTEIAKTVKATGRVYHGETC